MNLRVLVAILLTALVIVTVPRIFPTPKRPVRARPDSSLVQGQRADSAGAARPGAQAEASVPTVRTPDGREVPSAPVGAIAEMPAADTITVATPRVTYRFTTVGAAPVSALLTGYKSLAHKGQPVELVRAGLPLLRYRLAVGRDTLRLDHMPFAVDSTRAAGATGTAPLVFRAAIGPSAQATISYTFAPDSFLVRVAGEVTGLPGAHLLIGLPQGVRSEEADTIQDLNYLAYVVKPAKADAKSVQFAKVPQGQQHVEPGPLSWVASKNKYFLIGLLLPDSAHAAAAGRPAAFSGLTVTGGARLGRAARAADAVVVQPLTADSRFAFELYTGPQEWRRLHAIGRDFHNVNPYGGWLQGVVQPFATIVMRVLLWMHDRLQINYGWILILFGITIRLVLWPLNQGAMRNSLKMQRIQPELQALQKKYAKDPQKQQEMLMKLYKQHGMSPFTPILGCLPMLLPMPVLFALFFVFQNTIEFRGVHFLWLPDISQHDPYYILPVMMGISMFLLSWIGMRNQPPNPQGKMMMYILPVMMTVFLWKLAAGLNLYYAIQNLAAFPQQWLIAREREKFGPPPGAPVADVAGGLRKAKA